MKQKKYFGVLIFALAVLFPLNSTHASEKVNLYFFWGQGCPHCAEERVFLQKLVQNNKDISLYEYEVYNSVENRIKLQEAAKKLNTEVNGVPFLVIGEKYLVGYLNDETTGKKIESIIEDYKKTGCYDIFQTSPKEPLPPSKEECTPSEEANKPVLPKIGGMDLEKLSLPALTIALGFIDGFNPCAMWVLLFLISLLIGMQNKKRMWILGIAFIVSSASVYLLFMVAWLNLFLFVGYIFWVRAFIAGISLAGGIASLKKFLSKNTSGCDVVGEEKRKNIFEKLGEITSNKSFLMALIGIMALAFAVNLVELVCSAGLPAVYTQVLALNSLGKVKYYLYILLYIFFFMLDDLFVFFVAMFTLQMTGVTTKYVKWSRLIGGILMIAIGLLLLFHPEVLMFI
jgi:thiol-disulfide isomerase/thioredoxin